MAIVPWRGHWLWEPWENLDRWFEEWPEMKTSEFIPPIDVYEKGNKIIAEQKIPPYYIIPEGNELYLQKFSGKTNNIKLYKLKLKI